MMSFAIGITGVTGEVTLRVLEERAFPVGELRLFASRRSAGQTMRWKGRDYPIEALEDGRFAGLDLVISATSAATAREWAPRMVAESAIVIDQSSAFRQDSAVPLVIPEINAGDLASHAGIIAGPNCTTTVAVMAVAPLERAFGIDSVISSSYQAISGLGRDGMAEFLDLARKAADQPEALRGHEALDRPPPEHAPQVPAFNLFPQCETFREGSDISTEEEKMEAEMRKMLHAPALLVHATAVRVPVLVGHSVSLASSLRRETTPAECPHAGLLMTIDLGGVRCLEARGSGRVARNRASGTRGCQRGSGSPCPIERCKLPGHCARDRCLLALSRARGRCGLLGLRPMQALVRRR